MRNIDYSLASDNIAKAVAGLNYSPDLWDTIEAFSDPNFPYEELNDETIFAMYDHCIILDKFRSVLPDQNQEQLTLAEVRIREELGNRNGLLAHP